MHDITSDLVARAIAIIGADDISDSGIESGVLALAQDKMLARRLIDWIPEAFGMILIGHMAHVHLPTTFSARTKRGKWISFEFGLEPIFPIALGMAAGMYHSGPCNTFTAIVVRSCVLAVVNKALSQGADLEGAKLSGPALIGVRAEVYIPPQESLWRRIFR